MAILTLSFFCFLNNREFNITDGCLYDLAKRTAISQNKTKSVIRISNVLRKSIRRRNQSMTFTNSLISSKKNKGKSKLRLVVLRNKNIKVIKRFL